jgi:hypothetical protein
MVRYSKTTTSRRETYLYTDLLLQRIPLPISGRQSRRRRVGFGPVFESQRAEQGAGERGVVEKKERTVLFLECSICPLGAKFFVTTLYYLA